MQKTVNNVTTFHTYTNVSTQYSFVDRPCSIVITADSLTLNYNDYSESGPYRLAGNRLQIEFPNHSCEFAWQIGNDGQLTLNRTVNYVINDQTTHKAEDKYIIYARK
jgi:hypothetical protein